MTKYFDTNYHYMVPEVGASTEVRGRFEGFVEEVREAQRVVGVERAVPIVLGPVTLSRLCARAGAAEGEAEKGKGKEEEEEEEEGWRDELLRKLVPEYERLLEELGEAGVGEVQMHEPWLVTEGAEALRGAYETTYGRLAGARGAVRVWVCAHFGALTAEVYRWVVGLPVEQVTLDFTRGGGMLELVEREGFPGDKRLGAGVVDGRNVWRCERWVARALRRVVRRRVGAKEVVAATSCSLQFVPYDARRETGLDEGLRRRLAFAVQKLEVLVWAAREGAKVVEEGKEAKEEGEEEEEEGWEDNVRDVGVEAVGAGEEMLSREAGYEERRKGQVAVPALATTTIGSFPQTGELRRLRTGWRRGRVEEGEYREGVEREMRRAVAAQVEAGVDVVVHGEAERSDMVEHFAGWLEGVVATEHGWVQSYGSRYVRPPVVYGAVRRRGPMTVREFEACQRAVREAEAEEAKEAKAKKGGAEEEEEKGGRGGGGGRAVKGMLTGPVTLLNWSFCRVDVPRSQQAYELALAVREEVGDLERAGCRVVQVDEAALRERVPLRGGAGEREGHLGWATKAFRLATAGARSGTQVVTHMCYSSFEEILPWIDAMDADVLTIEDSRSDGAMLRALAAFGYGRGVGPGVYDIHSPVVPTEDELVERIRRVVRSGLPVDRLWVNPDCGLKTRKWEEVVPSLRNMVAAARRVRQELVVFPSPSL